LTPLLPSRDNIGSRAERQDPFQMVSHLFLVACITLQRLEKKTTANAICPGADAAADDSKS
jgi:hypothetical protein